MKILNKKTENPVYLCRLDDQLYGILFYKNKIGVYLYPEHPAIDSYPPSHFPVQVEWDFISIKEILEMERTNFGEPIIIPHYLIFCNIEKEIFEDPDNMDRLIGIRKKYKDEITKIVSRHKK